MITLYQLPPAFDLPVSVSPFCTKLEAYLRLADLEYETATADYRKAPNGKVPYITYEKIILGDSGKVIEWCKETFGDPLDGHLSLEQHQIGHLVRRTAEEHLYWSLLYSRFADEQGWQHQRKVVQGLLPTVLRPLLTNKIRNDTIKSMKGHGLGRHPQSYIYQAGLEDMRAILRVLEDKPFLFGDIPTSYDCSVYCNFLHILTTRSNNALTAGAQEMSNAVDYTKRMNEKLGFTSITI